MQVTVGNQLRIENPSEQLLTWCKKQLILPNPEYAKKVRMHFWVGNTPEKLYLFQWDGDTLVLPYGCLNDVLAMDDCHMKVNLPTPTEVDFGCTIPLYDYQVEAKEALITAYYGILQAPAGCGKTQIGIAVAADTGRRTLWLTHTRDLLVQSKSRAEQYMSPSLTGTITEGRVQIGKAITFATVQTMCNLDLSQYRDVWDCIIVDECFKGDTEVLTDKGFLRFDALQGDEKIAQYTEDGKIEFIEPISHIKRHHEGSLVKFTVKDGRDVYMTENHIQPLFYPRVNTIKREPIGGVSLCYGKNLIVSGEGTGNNSPLTPLERIAIASQADGTIQRICVDHISWSIQLKKSRKVDRIRELAKQADIPFTEIKSRDGYRRFMYQTPLTISKDLTTTFDINMGKNRAEDFIREICEWDGSTLGRYDYYYSSKVKKNAEFVSVIAFLGGYTSSITVQHDGRSENYSDIYRVYGFKRNYKDVQSCKKRYVPYSGDVYCVEVPSHMIIVRADGFAFVTGNCHRVAGTPTAMTQFSKVLNALAARHKYGLSATVHRADGMIAATYALLGGIAYQVPEEAVKDKIMTVSVLPRATHQGLSREFLDTDGTIIYAKLVNFLADRYPRNNLIVADLVANRDHYNLILSDRLTHLEALMNRLPPDLRKQAVMIDGKMTTKKAKALREQAIEEMRQGRKRYLFATYSLAKEGLDISRLDRLYLTTPQKDYAVITQSIGRIARTFEGKGEPIAYDYVDDGIQYLVRSYKKRCTTYRKAGCKFIDGEN